MKLGLLLLFAASFSTFGCSSESTGPGPLPAKATDADAATPDDGKSTRSNDGGAAVPDAQSPDATATPDAQADGGPTARSGLEGMCDHYVECGGSTYATAADCVDDSAAYWGACRRSLIDAFGECMRTIPCSEWNPEAYDPNATPCAAHWAALRQAPACR